MLHTAYDGSSSSQSDGIFTIPIPSGSGSIIIFINIREQFVSATNG